MYFTRPVGRLSDIERHYSLRKFVRNRPNKAELNGVPRVLSEREKVLLVHNEYRVIKKMYTIVCGNQTGNGITYVRFLPLYTNRRPSTSRMKIHYVSMPKTF